MKDYFLLIILTYVYFSYCIKLIAEKLDLKNSWFAFLPPLNIYLLCKAINRTTTFFYTWVITLIITFFVPVLFIFRLIPIIFWVISWIEISKLLNKKTIFGYLMLIAVINLFIVGFLAFSKEKNDISSTT